MNTIELNTTDAIRVISDEDLGAVTGGLQVYADGGIGGPLLGPRGFGGSPLLNTYAQFGRMIAHLLGF